MAENEDKTTFSFEIKGSDQVIAAIKAMMSQDKEHVETKKKVKEQLEVNGSAFDRLANKLQSYRNEETQQSRSTRFFARELGEMIPGGAGKAAVALGILAGGISWVGLAFEGVKIVIEFVNKLFTEQAEKTKILQDAQLKYTNLTKGEFDGIALRAEAAAARTGQSFKDAFNGMAQDAATSSAGISAMLAKLQQQMDDVGKSAEELDFAKRLDEAANPIKEASKKIMDIRAGRQAAGIVASPEELEAEEQQLQALGEQLQQIVQKFLALEEKNKGKKDNTDKISFDTQAVIAQAEADRVMKAFLQQWWPKEWRNQLAEATRARVLGTNAPEVAAYLNSMFKPDEIEAFAFKDMEIEGPQVVPPEGLLDPALATKQQLQQEAVGLLMNREVATKKNVADQLKAINADIVEDDRLRTEMQAAQADARSTAVHGEITAIREFQQLGSQALAGFAQTAGRAFGSALKWSAAYSDAQQKAGKASSMSAAETSAAIAQTVQHTLAGLAEMAFVKALFEVAEGIAATAVVLGGGVWKGPSAAEHFHAAAAYGAIAGVGAAGSLAIGASRGMTREESQSAGFAAGGSDGSSGGGTFSDSFGSTKGGGGQGGGTIRETIIIVGDPFETEAEAARRAMRRIKLAERLDIRG